MWWGFFSTFFFLNRYLMRTANHPALLKDSDVIQFLENTEVPSIITVNKVLHFSSVFRVVNKSLCSTLKLS